MKPSGFPVAVQLPECGRVEIRLMEKADGPAVFEFYRTLPEEDRLFLPENPADPAWIERYVSRIDHDQLIPLVALEGERLLGHADLRRRRRGWTRHVGDIRIVVARGCQRHGLGTAMAHQLVRVAIGLGLEKLTAEVVDNQVGAKRAFGHLGFSPEAVLRGHVKDVVGNRRDLVIMANDVSHIWDAMEMLIHDNPPA
jgi:RimJ/RimL family protein N-acetyltransferase